MKRLRLIFFICFYGSHISAQPVPFILKGALKENRQQLYRNIINNSINHNLSLPLVDSTEDQWQQAFYAIELLKYRQAWTDNKIHSAFNDIEKRSASFQRALLELAYSAYPGFFLNETKSLLLRTNDAKIFVMCAVYILANTKEEKNFIQDKLREKLAADKDNPLLQQLAYQVSNAGENFVPPNIEPLFQKDFLSGNIIMLSLQRRDRNYPGIVIVRDASGNFIKDENGKVFSVPQLARSISNLPGYLTNGNTPEGIFRMDKFDTSQSSFIGPTTNIQLTMPFEDSLEHFYQDLSLVAGEWDIDQYQRLLPGNLKNYYPLYQAWYAGKAGRTEIIAHGTTIDPGWYKGRSFYPLTPTLGCLCTKETWNEENGRLITSDQQKLVDAIIRAGGPAGYAIVVDIDDQQKPVTPDELLPFLPAN